MRGSRCGGDRGGMRHAGGPGSRAARAGGLLGARAGRWRAAAASGVRCGAARSYPTGLGLVAHRRGRPAPRGATPPEQPARAPPRRCGARPGARPRPAAVARRCQAQQTGATHGARKLINTPIRANQNAPARGRRRRTWSRPFVKTEVNGLGRSGGGWRTVADVAALRPDLTAQRSGEGRVHAMRYALHRRALKMRKRAAKKRDPALRAPKTLTWRFTASLALS